MRRMDSQNSKFNMQGISLLFFYALKRISSLERWDFNHEKYVGCSSGGGGNLNVLVLNNTLPCFLP